MTQATERQTKLKAIRQRLANLTAEECTAIAAHGLIATVDGRTLSLHNTYMAHLQSRSIPTVVGGYQQWKQAGKQVRRGEHGFTILFPNGTKDENGDVIEAKRFFAATVFDISQTEEA